MYVYGLGASLGAVLFVVYGSRDARTIGRGQQIMPLCEIHLHRDWFAYVQCVDDDERSQLMGRFKCPRTTVNVYAYVQT